MNDGTVGLRFSRQPTNGISLHVAEAGSRSDPLVFLLRGFPEFWYAWRGQMRDLAEAGLWIVAPDQRGYNLSDKPIGVSQYDLDRVADDIVGLADHFGRQTFAIVGHDWGASVGWWLATRHRERITRFAALNAPHPAANSGFICSFVKGLTIRSRNPDRDGAPGQSPSWPGVKGETHAVS
jgi:pimeloyl-ACP methyl ester carboxylesterase